MYTFAIIVYLIIILKYDLWIFVNSINKLLKIV